MAERSNERAGDNNDRGPVHDAIAEGTAPHPTKIAELYRLVTGGQPCKYILVASPAV